MSNEMITQLPGVLAANTSDIIYAVQGYVSPANPGLSVQETLGQVLALGLSQTILSFAGNPNGNVAGQTFQLCWDTADKVLYICTTTGTAISAVWTAVTSSTNGITWNDVTGSTQALVANNGYVTDNASGVAYSLPSTALLGSIIYIVGRQSGWSITQGAGQQIIIGNANSTVGTGGHIASTNAHDCVTLVCTRTNLEFTSIATQGNITLV